MCDVTLETLKPPFDSEDACIDWLYRLRWPDGFSCPCCGRKQSYLISTRRLPLYECRHCKLQTSLTAGTIFEKSRTPLTKWLYAIQLISRSDSGINAVRLAALISVTYKTAFHILRKIRLAIGSALDDAPLEGSVQAGLTFFRSLFRSMRDFGKPGHAVLTATAADTGVNGLPSQARMIYVPPEQVQYKNLLPLGLVRFAVRYVDSQADLQVASSSILANRYCRIQKSYAQGAFRWICDTFHGLGSAYLQTYLDEYSFRLNASLQELASFEQLARLCVCSPPDRIKKHFSGAA